MIQTVALNNDVHWLGILDPNLDVFDIIMETKYGTTYNSYLVNTTCLCKKSVLFLNFY